MTNLALIKTVFLDTDNVIFSDDEYSAFLTLEGLTPSDEASEDLTGLMLTKAALLEAIAGNPEKFKAYSQGSVQENYDKRFLFELAQSIRRRHQELS
ncbi:MAG TPA: hypothetical protein PLP59_09925 [Thermotogota bacterium]|nr:hypothetical protein [Thermotogota bacterium]HQN22508.1 hypothetical protein [Thermotogota bacterium]HQQ66345.1 hypothetical protein [Thermotogota bacterium]